MCVPGGIDNEVKEKPAMLSIEGIVVLSKSKLFMGNPSNILNVWLFQSERLTSTPPGTTLASP